MIDTEDEATVDMWAAERTIDPGCVRLWTYLLRQAVQLAVSSSGPNGDEARAWFARDPDDFELVGSFAWVCASLGVDGDVIRRRVLDAIEENAERRAACRPTRASVRSLATAAGVSPATAQRRAQLAQAPLTLFEGVLGTRRVRVA